MTPARIAAVVIALSSTGCATWMRTHLTSTASEKRPTTVDNWSDTDSLDRELRLVHGPEVVVSVAQLKKLVKKEIELRDQCRDLSDQLDALKGVDLKATEKRDN